VAFGDINHFSGLSAGPLDIKTSFKYCFDSASDEPNQVGISQLSGDFCDACLRGDLLECDSRADLRFESMVTMNTGSGATMHGNANAHLRSRALSLLAGAKSGDHCFVVFGCGVESLTPVELVDGKLRQESVAIYCAYDDADDGKLALNEAAVCRHKIETCGGVSAKPPCFKRHIQQVKLISLRPPVFQMTEEPEPRIGGVDAPPEPPEPLARANTRERHLYSLPQEALPAARAALRGDEAKFMPSVLY
jgi:hypothetical protein